MFVKLNLHLCLFVIFNYIHDGGTVNYNLYASNQAHLLHATNSDNDEYKNNAQPATDDYYTVYKQSQQNLQGNSNYPQLYRYYYTPPYQQQQQQQQQLQPPQPTQLWSGPPIVVEDDIQQQQSSSTAPNIPPTLYQQRSTSSMLLPSLHRNSKAVPPPVYSPQTTRTTQFNYNNNNNIVYHRDFRHQIDAIPVPQQHTTQQDWNNQQQQHQLLEPQQQQQQQRQQFYATNTNLRYNGISNDLTSLSKNNIPDYGEHFKRYLQNNPRRIRPIY